MIHLILISSGSNYDTGGISGLLMLTFPIWGVMFWLPNEIIFTLNNGESVNGQIIISFIIGLGICLGADYFINAIRKKRSNVQVNT